MSDPHTDPTGLPRDSAEAASNIRQFTNDIVGETLTVRALAATLRGAKKLIEEAARQYAERFLFELIQNAYDAQPPKTRGRVRVLLDAADGLFGCVYVANTGTPFTAENFRAICEIAQSSKQPGEGIGNKGIGFKSVLQISEWPEIYSRSASADGFDGYCFRFATPDDLSDLVDTREDADILADRISPYGLPIHIQPDGLNATLRALDADGFASVVRLPLRNEEAVRIARAQLREATSKTAPILLFLDRIARLEVDVAEHDGYVERHGITREELPGAIGPDGIEGSEIVLADTAVPTEERTYLILTSAVDRAAFLSAIEDSIKATLLDEAWRGWKGEARVSVAVQLGREGPERARLYCYLPMGAGVDGPFAGHLNAPFAVKLARDGLVQGAPLNSLLFGVAADMIAKAWPAVRAHREGRSAVVDLVAWKETDAPKVPGDETTPSVAQRTLTDRLITAFARTGTDLAGAPLVPALGEPGWTDLRSATTCPVMHMITPNAVAAAGFATVLDPALGDERTKRLDRLASVACDRSLAPAPSVLADWAEALAVSWWAACERRPEAFRPAAWAGLYDDLAQLFDEKDPGPLHGRRLLIDDAYKIHRTAGGPDLRQPTIFFPRREVRDDGDLTADGKRDVSIPRTLERHLGYVHKDIDWKVTNPATGQPQNRPGREFLHNSGLVGMPRTQELFVRIAAVLKRSDDKQKHLDALKLAFNLTQARQYTQSPTVRELNIKIRTADDELHAASEAVFSAAWPGTTGDKVEALIGQAAGASDEIASLTARLLRPPSDYGVRPDPDEIKAWIEFLGKVGVVDGLPLVDASPSLGDMHGEQWADALARSTTLPTRDHDRWDSVIRGWPVKPKHPYSPYRLAGRVMRLPASGDYEQLPQAARETFGRLAVAGLATWGKDELHVAVAKKPGGPKDEVLYPSPVTEFLRREAWLPVTRPGEPGQEDFEVPASAWHYTDSDNEAQPTFMPLVVTSIRKLLDSTPPATASLRALGLNVWNERTDSMKRLRVLASTYAGAGVPDTLVANFRKAYERTWTLVADSMGGEPAGRLSLDDHIVVTRRGRLGTHALSDPMPPHVLVDEDRLVAAILDTLDLPVLRADPRDGAYVAALLEDSTGVTVTRLGKSDVRVLVDGDLVADRTGIPLTAPGREWLRDLLVLTLEFKASAFNRQTEARISAAKEQLRLIRLHAGASVEVELRGEVVPLPGHLRRVFAIATPGHPAIAYAGVPGDITWDALVMLAPKIGELAVGSVENTNALESVIISLAKRLGGTTLHPPVDEDYAAVFEESAERIAQVRLAHQGGAAGLAYLLRPIIAALCDGEDLLGHRVPAADPDADTVRLALEAIAARLPEGVSVTRLLQVVGDAATLDEARDAFHDHITYGSFNRALKSLPGYTPIHNKPGHAVAMATYLAARSSRLMQHLRSRALADFDRSIVPAEYAAKTADLRSAQLRRAARPDEPPNPLDPDPAWLDDYDLPPDALLAERVGAWLGDDLSPAGNPPADLPPLEAVRLANVRAVTGFAERAAFRLGVWAAAQRTTAAPEISADDFREALGGQGLLDFRVLDDDAIIAWLARLGRWPASLPDSIELDRLGLTEEDLDAERAASERARLARLEERRSIELVGKGRVSMDPDGLPDLIEAIRAGLSASLLRTPERPVAILEVPPVPPKGPGDDETNGPKGGKPEAPPKRMTSEQTDLVGFMGELVAYEWLKRRHGSNVLWRSAYRRHVIPDGDLGSDRLGYDMEVLRTGRQPLLYEVKASTSDEFGFEMSGPEIAFAQRHATDDRYRIIYVASVNDPARRRLMVLPNPASAAGRGRYKVIGRGVSYGFTPEPEASG